MKPVSSVTEKEQPTVVIQAPVLEQPASPNGSSHKRLYVTVAVTATIVTLVVVTGFVLAFHFYSKTTHDILKHQLRFKDSSGDEVSEEVEADMTENVAYMKVDRGVGGIQHILHDFNRKISLVKVDSVGGSTCYLSALNTTAALATSVLDEKNEDQEESSDVGLVYITDPSPVSTLSFLSPKAQELCEGHPTHWSHPTCAQGETMEDQGQDSAAGRSKRASYQCSNGCCWRVCCRRITYAVTWKEGGLHRCQWGCQGFIRATKSAAYCPK